jgi:hypothetical protein
VVVVGWRMVGLIVMMKCWMVVVVVVMVVVVAVVVVVVVVVVMVVVMTAAAVAVKMVVVVAAVKMVAVMMTMTMVVALAVTEWRSDRDDNEGSDCKLWYLEKQQDLVLLVQTPLLAGRTCWRRSSAQHPQTSAFSAL